MLLKYPGSAIRHADRLEDGLYEPRVHGKYVGYVEGTVPEVMKLCLRVIVEPDVEVE